MSDPVTAIPIGDFNQRSARPILEKGATVEVELLYHDGCRWAGKIVGLGLKTIVLEGEQPAPGNGKELVLLKEHPHVLHGRSRERRQLVLRPLPRDVERQYLAADAETRAQLLAELARQKQTPKEKQAAAKAAAAALVEEFKAKQAAGGMPGEQPA